MNHEDQMREVAEKEVSGLAHPAARLFPLLNKKEMHALAQDIADHGQTVPIRRERVVDADGTEHTWVVDGRNRLVASRMAGVEPTYVDGTAPITEEQAVALVISLNLARRHLSLAQRAAIAADLKEMLAKDADKRKKAGTSAPNGTKGTASAQAAEVMGVSARSVDRAAKVKREDPKTHEAIKRGEVKHIPTPKPERDSLKVVSTATKGYTTHPVEVKLTPPKPAKRDTPTTTADDVSVVVVENVVEVLDDLARDLSSITGDIDRTSVTKLGKAYDRFGKAYESLLDRMVAAQKTKDGLKTALVQPKAEAAVAGGSSNPA